MLPNYLYIAQAQADPNVKKHNVYKVGQSAHPLERIRTLGGSGSTDTYEPILIVALPRHVKDTHILSHRCIQKFVVGRHEDMRSKYITIFGSGHATGLKRRREIVMFGHRYAVSRIKDLFRQVVKNVSSRKGNYVCMDTACVSNGGPSDCAVCLKFTSSLLNCISYQKEVNKRFLLQKHRRILESVETKLIALMAAKKKRKPWKGPSVGSFWLVRPENETMCRVVRITSNDKRNRSSGVCGWEPRETVQNLIQTLQSRFIEDDNGSTNLGWDRSGWKCVVEMRRFNTFGRIQNVSDVRYGIQQWSSPVPKT